jgi:uncharacterized Zn finger protein (UPF0148 family)
VKDYGILQGAIGRMMPGVWHSYTCARCACALARGGGWADVACPSCGRPMQRLAEHHPEARQLSDAEIEATL